MTRLIPHLGYGNDEGYPERLLLPMESCTWNEVNVLIEDRGVNGEWIFNLIHEIQYLRYKTMDQIYFQNKARIWYDNVPEPDNSSPMGEDLTATNLVGAHIIPWTKEISSPLYARTPLQARGKPSIFVSHTWNSGMLGGGYGTIYAIKEYLTSDYFIWMDIFCHNQHQIGSVAKQMELVIRGVDLLLLPMSQFPRYDRTWCIWEVLCALQFNKEIVFLDYDQKERDYKNIQNYFLKNFTSITKSNTSLPKDKKAILDAVILFFGSIEEADKYILNFMREKLNS